MTTKIVMMAIICLSASIATAQFTTTASGLKYKIDEPGNDKHPQKGCRVWLEYTGWLDNDTIFVSTEETGSVDFWLGQGQVIKGWEEALPLIGEGGTIHLTVPPHLGYGGMAIAGIPENSTLHFKIKVIQVDVFEPIKSLDTNGTTANKLPNGIVYYAVQNGHGQPASKGDNVYVHYTGWLPDGSIYSSTIHSGSPTRFTAGCGETIEGLDTAFLLIPEGGKYKFMIPWNLAFGEKGYGNRIPPKTDITIDIEMVHISKEIMVEKWDASGHDTLSTASGLRYIVFDAGDGEQILRNSIVTAHYSGYLPDGTLFDSSVKRESPIRYPVGAGIIIDGLDEASLLMRRGSRFQLLIPSNLAYGEEGLPPTIPANADLVFDVEILDVIE